MSNKTFSLAEIEALSEQGKTLVYVSTPTCFPCKALKPIAKKVCEELNITLVDVDATYNEEFCAAYNVRKVPTLILLEKDKTNKINTGFINEKAFTEFITN